MPHQPLNALESSPWRSRLPWLLLATALLLCAAAGLRLFRAQQRLAEVVRWQTHTYQLLRALDGAMESIQEADSTQRGYLVTGDARYLKHHADAKEAIKGQFGRIRELAADNPSQMADLAELARLEETRLDTEGRVIQAKDAGDAEGIQQIIQQARGKGSMEDIRVVHGRMVERELFLLNLRERAVLDGHAAASRGMAVLAVAAALLVALGLGMMLRLRRERTQLESAWRRNTAILDTTPDFIGTIAPDGQVTYWNPASRRLHGLDPEGPAQDLEGWSIYDAHTEESGARLRDVALPTAAAQGVWSGESVFLDADGGRLPVSQVILVHKDAAGRVVGYSSVARDIAEQKATERLKNDFVSTVNHELRTPLTSIKGSLGLLLAGPLPDPARQMVEIAHRNSERLSRIIDDILDLEKLEAEGLEFHREPLEAAALVARAVEATRPYCAGLGIGLACEAVPPGTRILVDEGRFLQVLANLLSNAAKFSPSGGVVGLRVLAAPDQPDWVRVEVENGGPGVPESFRPRIFQRFSQADPPTGERQGTGLGLSIAKTIIERLGGRIGFESAPGRTVFWVELPEAREASGATLDG